MILITGATGEVGKLVWSEMLRRGEPARAFVRDPRKLTAANGAPAAEVVVGDFTRPETFAPALAGVRAVFLMNRGLDAVRLQAFLAAAQAAGCERIVFLSSLAADNPALAIGRLHLEQEQAITASGLTAKFLRAGGFMSNALQWTAGIRRDGTVPNPLGDTRYAPIAPADIAAVAVAALLTPDRRPAAYELTGGEWITLPGQVAILSEILGRPLRTVEITRQQAEAGMVAAGLPPHMAAAVADSLEAVRRGEGTLQTDTVAQVLGRPPQTFRQWATLHAYLFSAPVAAI